MIQSGEAPFKTSEELPPLSGELNHALSPQGGQIPGFSPYVLSAPHLHGATHYSDTDAGNEVFQKKKSNKRNQKHESQVTLK